MIISKKQDISVSVDPISFATDIKVLAGNTVQTYNNDTGEYEPDRSLVPCVIIPYVSVSDPEGIMNGEQAITSIMYFEGAPDTRGYSNQIVSSDDENASYRISASGTPTYSLTVLKNFDVNNPMDIYAIYTITDKRTNKALTFEKQITFYTGLFESTKSSLKLDCEKSWEIDVTQEVADESGNWMHSITGQLYLGQTAVDDANAAYWWKITDDGSFYRDFTDEEMEMLVTGKDENGYWGRTLTFDARMFRKATFRLTAAHYTDERPTVPDSPHLQAVTSVKTSMPPTLDFLIQQESGIKINSSMNNNVRFTCTPKNNREAISSTDLFRVDWYAGSGKSGVSDKFIGSGLDFSFIPSSLGFDINSAISVYAKIYVYSTHAVLTSDGNTVITDNDICVIDKKIE